MIHAHVLARTNKIFKINARFRTSSYHTAVYQATVGCFLFTKFCWAGKLIPGNCYNQNRQTPQPKANPTQERKNRLKKWCLGHFFPQQIIFRGLGLVLYRKQTTRSLTQPKFTANTLLYSSTRSTWGRVMIMLPLFEYTTSPRGNLALLHHFGRT